MPIEFIPNQPVVFENPIGDYPCLNNDTKAYGPLMQLGDEMCMQWKMTPCGTPLCEPDMVGTPGSDLLGTWTVSGGWDTTGPSNLSFDGTGNPGGTAWQVFTITTGRVYKLTFDVSIYTGTISYTINVGFGTQSITINQTGSYTFYFIAFTSGGGISLNVSYNGTSDQPDQLLIENLEVIEWTQCWEDGLHLGSNSWNYDYDPITQLGRFCSSQEEGSLINTQAFINTGYYHGITFVISNCTQGGVEVYVDGGTTPIGTTSGNGQFSYYGNPAGQDLIFVKVGGFDGCINQVVVNDYGDTNAYLLSFESSDATVTSTTSGLDVYDDRLVWCGTFGSLTWTVNGVPDLDAICGQYYAKIYDPCDDVTHTSVNLINYDPAGHDCTKFVEAWNDGYAFGFYFGDVNAPDFKLKQRLRVLAFNPVYRNSGEEYLYSSGQTVRSYAQSQKARTAWFDYADEYCHDTIRTQLLSQKLTVEGVSFYFPTEDYEPEWNDRGRYNLAQSRVTLFHELSTFGSTCGIIANPFCPPTQQACQVEELYLKGEVSNGGFDFTNCILQFIGYNPTGIAISPPSCNVGPYDLTTAGGRASLATDIKCHLDDYFNTSSSGTVTLVGSTITLNFTAVYSGVLPLPSVSMVIYDTLLNVPFSFNVSFQ